MFWTEISSTITHQSKVLDGSVYVFVCDQLHKPINCLFGDVQTICIEPHDRELEERLISRWGVSSLRFESTSGINRPITLEFALKISITPMYRWNDPLI